MDYLWHILILICLYTILAMSLNVIVGYTGMLSLCHAAFYGIGGYSVALLMVNLHWQFLPAIFFAMFISAMLSLIVSLPSLRLRGDFFVLATLAFQVITFSLLYNWTNLTHGPYGISDIPSPSLLGVRIDTAPRYAILASGIACMCGLLILNLIASPFGRVLVATRDDQVAATALGKNTLTFRILAFAIGAAIAAVAGGLYACYARYIDPTSFNTLESIFILSVLVAGGAGSMYGPVTGAVLLIVLPEILRFLPLTDAIAANLRQIIYGMLLIVLMRFRPQGIQGKYKFD